MVTCYGVPMEDEGGNPLAVSSEGPTETWQAMSLTSAQSSAWFNQAGEVQNNNPVFHVCVYTIDSWFGLLTSRLNVSRMELRPLVQIFGSSTLNPKP